VREQEPHENETTRTNTIINALKRRAQAVLNDKSIDPQHRTIVRYALEINDPWLVELVRRADAGESIFETPDFLQTPERIDELGEEKVEALAEMICRAGDEPAAALFVLMGTLENSRHPKVLANAAKHFASCDQLCNPPLRNCSAAVNTKIAKITDVTRREIEKIWLNMAKSEPR